MKLFLKKLLFFALIISVLIGGLNVLYASHLVNFGTMGTQKNDSAYIADVPSEIQICNFGNSHGYYGFNYEDYDGRYTCFNFSLPSQSMSYNYRILENYKNNIADGAKIYICLSYQTFFGNPEIEGSSFASMNKRYYHFLKDEFIKEYDLKTDIFINYLPMLIDNNVVSLAKTLLGVSSSANDLWADTTDEEKAIEHGGPRSAGLIKGTLDSEGNRLVNDEEITALYQMIDLCNEIGATPILITTPYLSEYTDPMVENDPALLEDFYGIISDVQAKTGVQYYDYSTDKRFSSRYDWFFNTDHMNREGARQLTEILFNDTMD